MMPDVTDSMSEAGGKAQNGLTRKAGPLPLWGWAALGAGLFFLYLKMRNKGTANSTIPLTQAPAGYSLSGDGGGFPPPGGPFPPTPVPPPSGGNPPSVPIPPANPNQTPSWGFGAPLIGYFTNGGGIHSNANSTYGTYNTPSGGPPSMSNPAPEMANWTQADWNNYAQSLAHEWGISTESVLNSLGRGGGSSEFNSLSPNGMRGNGSA